MDKKTDPLEVFFKAFDEKERKKQEKENFLQKILKTKREKLDPIKQFLREFEKIHVKVRNSDNGTPGVGLQVAQRFTVYEKESSSSWSPGVSIYFDHPLKVEIAVPNDSKQGLFVINTVTDDPIWTQKFKSRIFKNADEVKQILAVFMAEMALSIDNDPRFKERERLTIRPDDLQKMAPKDPRESDITIQNDAEEN